MIYEIYMPDDHDNISDRFLTPLILGKFFYYHYKNLPRIN